MSEQQSHPFADLAKLIEHFKIPGFDASAIIETGRKDLEALVAANKAAYHGFEALAHKQSEIFSQAVQKIRDVAAQGATDASGASSGDLARQAYRKALADMKELADIVRKSQTEAMTKVADRAIEHLQELKKMLQPK